MSIRSNWTSALLVLAASAFASPAFAVVRNDGTAGDPADFPCAVQLGTNGDYFCSGTVICGGAYVITAGHCAEGQSLDGADWQVQNQDGTVIQGAMQVRVHPTADLAIICLDGSFDDFYELYMGDIEGMTVAFTGFGSTGVNDVAGDGSDDGSFGTPRQGENVIDAAVGGLVGFEFENPGLGGSEATTFPGDSGMGYLKEVNGEFQLLGVHSGITDADDLNEYGAISFGVNVQTYKDWIEAKGIPEPSTFVLLGLGGLGLIFHRSRLSARTRAA